jgi:hypothetical protein
VEHIVFFTGADGASQSRRTPSLEEAVRVVEHLRNVEGVEDSRVYAMTEVPLAFKTVYRVEIPGQPVDPAAPLPPLPPMPAMPELDVPVAEAEPAPVPEPDPAPAMAAVPGEPYAPETPQPVSNGKPAARGTGFFSR